MNPDTNHQTTTEPTTTATVDAGPLGVLPRLSHRRVQLERRLARLDPDRGPLGALAWLLIEPIGAAVHVGQVEVRRRAAGLQRAGVVAQWVWPRMATRVGLGIEVPLVHALVDRLLGFDRLPGEGRLQITPVEWGILTFAIAEALARLAKQPGPLGPWDLTLDRVSLEPFDISGLGSIGTLRWPVRVGDVSGSIRLWLPDSLTARWMATEPPPPPDAPPIDAESIQGRLGDLTSTWHAEAGTVTLNRGLGKLRLGGVLALDGDQLRGAPQSPSGTVELALRDRDGRLIFPAEPTPWSGGAPLTLTNSLRREPAIREALAVNPTPEPEHAPQAGGSPTDLPVTLTVELGRISLPLRRLATLKAGDVLELGRHAREPIELTSGGKLVARGELVQIDTELGVRITSLFL